MEEAEALRIAEEKRLAEDQRVAAEREERTKRATEQKRIDEMSEHYRDNQVKQSPLRLAVAKALSAALRAADPALAALVTQAPPSSGDTSMNPAGVSGDVAQAVLLRYEYLPWEEVAEGEDLEGVAEGYYREAALRSKHPLMPQRNPTTPQIITVPAPLSWSSGASATALTVFV